MAFYDERIFPALLDRVMNNHVMDRQRARTVCRAGGVVLEVGAGSGLNGPFIDTRRVDRWIALEPSSSLRSRLQERSLGPCVDVQVLDGVAEALPIPSGTIDSALLTYTLCSVREPEKALVEIHRVLKPGGNVFFSEHGLAPHQNVQRLQHVATPWWKKIACGCHLNRDVAKLMHGSPFDVSEIRCAYLPGPRFLSYTTWGFLTKMRDVSK